MQCPVNNVRVVGFRELLNVALDQVDDPEGDALSLLSALAENRPALKPLQLLVSRLQQDRPPLRLVG